MIIRTERDIVIPKGTEFYFSGDGFYDTDITFGKNTEMSIFINEQSVRDYKDFGMYDK